MKYYNYHCHSFYGNPVSMDVTTSPEDYCKRAVELGHDAFFTTCHGTQGDIFVSTTLAHQYNLKMIVGAELYYVNDRYEKDRSNRHIIIVALNHDGIRDLNRIISESFTTGMYYKPRIDHKLLFSLNPHNVVITTACVAGLWNNEELIKEMKDYFGEHIFLEVQDHNENIQKEVNTTVLRLSQKYNIRIIHANDSHYIYPTEKKEYDKVVINNKEYELKPADRDLFLNAKGIVYEEETNFILDYPEYDEIIKRYEIQGILNKNQIKEALDSTLIFEGVDCSDYINDNIKLPSVSDNPIEDLKQIINESWKQDKNRIPKERHKEYLEAIRYEVDIIEKTNMANYFLIDYYIAKIAKEKYGGVLTNTGRGSAPSFYVTRLLHLTNIDRLESPITLFPTRFMSIERILGARSLPDIDLNTADAEPFIQASKDLLGENNCGWMISWKPLQEASGFRLYCKAIGMNIGDYNEIAKDLDKYKEDPIWSKVIEASKPFIGVVEGVSESPCFVKGTKIKTSNGYKNIENLNTSDLVLTHNNQYKQVIRTMNHEVDSVIELKNMGSLPIKTTFNHPFYIRKHIGRKYFLENNKYKSIRKFTNPYWEQASNLTKGDYIGMPVNFKSIIPQWANLDLSDENIWWIIGRYIGDGWLRLIKKGKNHGQSYHTLICCNKNDNEQQEIEERISKCFNYTKTEENTTYRYDISLKSLYSYLEKFGKGAKEKHLIEDVYDLPVHLLKAFLEGYQSADGYSPKNRNDIFYTSISYDLILGLQNCIHKCYKVPTTIICRKKENVKPSVLLDGRKIIAKNDIYILSFRLNSNKYNGFFEDNYMWLPFRYKKEIIENNIVYNISVKDDESYTVNNIAVHNCSMVLYDKDVRSEIGMIKTPNGKICCMLDGYNCDKYKYLKNDYLTVTVWAIIRDVCKLANISIPSINELNKLLDDKTFDVYKKGLTCTINQADSDYATGLVMRYKPKSLAEMSSFVAIIRPGCASLLDDFIERKPYTTGVQALDNILEDSEHRLIYQESIMKYLIWLGISEPQSYDVIKKIAKKKFKEQELKDLKAQLIEGWKKQVGEEKGFNETWQVVEDAAKYSFNASHSLSYAYDSLYGAYLKSHYPLEYYTVVLNYYSNDATRTGKLTKELKAYGISLEKPQFRYSIDEYFMDKKNNKIYKGTGAIKFLNKECSLFLYSLKDNKYDTFIDLLSDITDSKDEQGRAYVNTRQIDILIKSQYFQEFGNNKKLLTVYNYFKELYGRKVLSKSKAEELQIPDKYLNREDVIQTEKQFKFENICDILKLIEYDTPDESFSVKEQVEFEMDALGYIGMTYNVDKKVCYVLDVDIKYTPKITLYCLNNGKTVLCKVNKTLFKNSPLKKGMIIRAIKFEEKNKLNYVNGKWQRTSEKEWWMNGYHETTIEEEQINEN